MPTEATLTRMLRSLGAQRQWLDTEIRRLEQIVDESGTLPPRNPPHRDGYSIRTAPHSAAARGARRRASDYFETS